MRSTGIVVKVNKDFFTVLLENNNYLECRTRGKLKNDDVIVGDKVLVDENLATIESILERKNSLIRPLIANINKLIIVCSTKEPDFSTFLLDKFILLALLNKIKPVIVMTKFDLLNLRERKYIKNTIKYYKKLGYDVYLNTELKKIKREFKESIVALAGQTGAGKSTLLNRIDKSLKLETNEISQSLGRGKHTTRIVSLYKISEGLVADTPGFSSLDVNFDKRIIKDGFIEFNKYDCKYTSCLHYKEDGCEVKKALNNNKILRSRYENYIKLINEVK